MSANNYYEVINTKIYISHCCMCQEIESKNHPRAKIKVRATCTCSSLLKTILSDMYHFTAEETEV